MCKTNTSHRTSLRSELQRTALAASADGGLEPAPGSRSHGHCGEDKLALSAFPALSFDSSAYCQWHGILFSLWASGADALPILTDAEPMETHALFPGGPLTSQAEEFRQSKGFQCYLSYPDCYLFVQKVYLRSPHLLPCRELPSHADVQASAQRSEASVPLLGNMCFSFLERIVLGSKLQYLALAKLR